MAIGEDKAQIKRIMVDTKKAVDGNNGVVKSLQDAQKRLAAVIEGSDQPEADEALKELEQITKEYETLGTRLEQVEENVIKVADTL